MKKLLLLPLLFLLFAACGSDDTNSSNPPVVEQPLAEQTLLNVSYGNDAQQKMDVYLPEGRTEDTKVFVLIHGGFWSAGSKEDLAATVQALQQLFPDHAIVNINYRLAAWGSPAYPKQINDITSVLEFLEASDYHISNDYALIGGSAGAHLSMLYGYKFNENGNIKVVCSIVGPADFLDPAYLEHPQFQNAAVALIGTANPTTEEIEEVNPVSHITAQSPPTITFYGGQDELVPASQGPRLKAKLDEFNIHNELNFYPDSGHDGATMTDMPQKLVQFLQQHF